MKLQHIREARLSVQHPAIKWIYDECYSLRLLSNRPAPNNEHSIKNVSRDEVRPIYQAFTEEFGPPYHEQTKEDYPEGNWTQEWEWQYDLRTDGGVIEFAFVLRYNDKEAQILLEMIE